MTKGQQAIRDFNRATRDKTGNLPPLQAIFPDTMAPVVRNEEDGEREFLIMRWGMPGPAQFGGASVTNIRNTASPYWRRWLGPASRCLSLAQFFVATDTGTPEVGYFDIPSF